MGLVAGTKNVVPEASPCDKSLRLVPKGVSTLKDVPANCFCASLLCTPVHTPRHALERALSKCPIPPAIIRVITKSRESDLFISSMITGRIWRHKVSLPINHKNYNFRKKNRKLLKEKENSHYNTEKGSVNILRPPRPLLVIRRQKHKSKCACTHASNYNFECDWLI